MIDLSYFEKKHILKRLEQFKKEVPSVNDDFIQLARDGDGKALYTIGSYYYEKRDKKSSNYTKAYDWYTISAFYNYTKGYYRIAMMKYNGRGTRKCISEALSWFKRAAHVQQEEAYYQLAFMYERGIGTKVDMKLAHYWYIKAIESGDVNARIKFARENIKVNN